MSEVNIQSLFKPPEKHPPAWRSHVTSGTLHVVLFLILAAITVPTVRHMKHEEHVTLIAPVIQEYQPKIPPPRQNVIQPKLLIQRPMPPKVLSRIQPPVVKPVLPKTQIVAAAPDVKPIQPTTPNLPEAKLAPAPKLEVHTGAFQPTEQAKAQQAPKVVAVGGFGDPNAAPANSRNAAVNMAKVGAFDMPAGSGSAGGGGRGAAGGVRPTSLGGFGDGTATATASHKGTVQTGGFGDSTQVAAQAERRALPQQPVITPVEIVYKPKPVYTQEARALKIQGQVSLQVVFTATGSIRVLRVVHGLGHGLDQAAEQAAAQVKFRPAKKDGVPVDTNATINITFELT